MTEVESVQVDIGGDLSVATVHFKELAYDDFGSSETLRPHKVSRLFEAGRTMSLRRGFLEGSTLVNQDYALFIMVQHYTYHPDLWSVRRGHTFPFKIETRLLDVGRSSATLQSRLINKLDGRTLATLDFKSIYVSRHRKRSHPMPDWVLAKYRSIVEGNRRPMEMAKALPEVPMSAYKYDVRVAESDTDSNGHTNQSSYVRYSCDATHAAVKEGRLSRLQPNAWLFPLGKLQALHSGETWMGDQLVVSLWQQEDCADTVCCVIRRQAEGQERAVFQARMVFGQRSNL